MPIVFDLENGMRRIANFVLRVAGSIFVIWFFGTLTATAGKAGYFHALLHAYNVPLPSVSWLWILICGVVSVALIIWGSLIVVNHFPKLSTSWVAAFYIFAIGNGLSMFLAYGVGHLSAHVLGSHQPVEIADIMLEKPVQVAFFYRSESGDAIGVVVDQTTHKLGHELFSTPVIHGKLNCNPIRINSSTYSSLLGK